MVARQLTLTAETRFVHPGAFLSVQIVPVDLRRVRLPLLILWTLPILWYV